MDLLMLETREGSVNGRDINVYHADEVYSIPESLGKVFVEEGWAEIVLPDVNPAPVISEAKKKTKAMKPAADKMMRKESDKSE